MNVIDVDISCFISPQWLDAGRQTEVVDEGMDKDVYVSVRSSGAECQLIAPPDWDEGYHYERRKG